MRRTLLETMLEVGLVAGIIVTGVALVATTHESRRLFQELQSLQREEDRLQDDWRALQLEVYTLGGHARIDDIAHRDLGMIEPGPRLQYQELPR